MIKKIAEFLGLAKSEKTQVFVRDFIAETVYEISAIEMEDLEKTRASLIKEGKYKDVYCVL